jgi:hypothetical protein
VAGVNLSSVGLTFRNNRAAIEALRHNDQMSRSGTPRPVVSVTVS